MIRPPQAAKTSPIALARPIGAWCRRAVVQALAGLCLAGAPGLSAAAPLLMVHAGASADAGATEAFVASQPWGEPGLELAGLQAGQPGAASLEVEVDTAQPDTRRVPEPAGVWLSLVGMLVLLALRSTARQRLRAAPD